MTYTHLGIESKKSHTQAFCTRQRLMKTALQSRLKKFLDFSIKQHSISAFSGDQIWRKTKKIVQKQKQWKVAKKLQYFMGT